MKARFHPVVAATLAKTTQEMLWPRQVTVTANAVGPPLSVTVQFADGTTQAGVRYLKSYTPTINDVVWALQNGTDLMVLGVLA